MNEKPMVCDSACDSSHVGRFSGGSISAKETRVSSGIVDVVSAPENVEDFHGLAKFQKFYRCRLCWKKFPDRALLGMHHSLIHEAKNCTPQKPLLTIHEETSVASNSSASTFQPVAQLKNVENLHRLREPYYECGLCRDKYSYRAMLEEHHSRMHEAKNCTHEKPLLTIHQETSVASNSFGSTFFQPVAQLRNVENLPRLREPFYECGLCRKKFPYKAMLEKHHSLIHVAQNFTPEKPLLTVHQETSVTSNSFGSTFFQPVAEFKNVENVHRLRGPYECGLCRKKFPNKAMFEKHHSLIHVAQNLTLEKPLRNIYQKMSVGSGFPDAVSDRDILRLRQPRHECEVCERKFQSGAALNVHSRTHREEKRWRPRTIATTNRVPYFRPKDESGSCDICKRPVLRKIVRTDNFTSAGKQILCADCKKTFDFEITIK